MSDIFYRIRFPAHKLNIILKYNKMEIEMILTR